MAALLCVLALPRVASASVMASVAQCAESSEPVFASLTPVASETLADQDDADDDIDVAGAPMSLDEGASAVAPRPVDNPSDARIEAVKRCQDNVENDVAHSPNDHPPLPKPSSVMAATLPTPLALPAVVACEHEDQADPEGAPKAGVRRGVDRPPRV
jgi:hypothetical protein